MDLDHYPVYPYFIDYMDDRGTYDIGRLDWLADLNPDETILSAYLLASTGGWDDGDAASRIVEPVLNEVEDISYVSNHQGILGDTLRGALQEVDEVWDRDDWIHSHRSGTIGQVFHWNWESVASHTVDEWSRFTSALQGESPSEWLQRTIESNSDPFFSAFNDLSSIGQFGRLTTFDCLEIINRPGGIDGLYPSPTQPRWKYINSDDPRDGFKIVFCSNKAIQEAAEEARDMQWIEAKRNCLGKTVTEINHLLTAAAKDIVSKTVHEPETVVYEMESCFCTFSKDNDFRDYLPES